MRVKKTKAGRPKVKKGDKKQRIPISAKIKNHPAIKAEFEKKIEDFEEKLESK